MSEPDTVWVSSGGRNGGKKKTMHASPDCGYLKNARKPIPKDAAALPHHEPCSRCFEGAGE